MSLFRTIQARFSVVECDNLSHQKESAMPSPKFLERKNPQIKEKEYVKSVIVCLNPQDNGGESVILEVDFFHNGDPQNSIYTNIHITTCYGVHSTRQSFWSVGLEAFQKAFTHMEEVAYLLEKAGSPNPTPVSPKAGLESTAERKLARIKELIEGADDYDVLQDIANIVGASTQ
jgi:hypothetical protein